MSKFVTIKSQRDLTTIINWWQISVLLIIWIRVLIDFQAKILSFPREFIEAYELSFDLISSNY